MIKSIGTWSGSTCYLTEASKTLSNRAKVCDGDKIKSNKKASFAPAGNVLPAESKEAVPVTELRSSEATPAEMIVDGPGPNNDSLSHEAVADSLPANDNLADESADDESNLLLTSPLTLQAKLKVNKPGDKYEHEADRVAKQVMQMPEPKLQRQCACGKSSAGGECPECKKKQMAANGSLQRVASSPLGGITAPPIVSDVLSASGTPLPASTQSFMESRFGQDFSQVRVHTDQRAAESAAAVQARAYTVGNRIVFGKGEGPTNDPRLMAHELTHVIQQSADSPRSKKMSGRQLIQRTSSKDNENSAASMREAREDYFDQTGIERIGSMAIQSVGYEELIRKGREAGLFRIAGHDTNSPLDRSESNATAGVLQRQVAAPTTFGAEVASYARTAAITSQLDGPEPGPADVVALGILAVGLVAAGYMVLSRTQCDAAFIDCLENPWQPNWNKGDFGNRKDCPACYSECKGAGGVWPEYKCPT